MTSQRLVLLHQIEQLRTVDMSYEKIYNITKMQSLINEKRKRFKCAPIQFRSVIRVEIPTDMINLTTEQLEDLVLKLMNEFREWVHLQSKLNNCYLEYIILKINHN